MRLQIIEATAAKDDLYEKLCDTQMQLMDRTNEKERLEHQVCNRDKVKVSTRVRVRVVQQLCVCLAESAGRYVEDDCG